MKKDQKHLDWNFLESRIYNLVVSVTQTGTNLVGGLASVKGGTSHRTAQVTSNSCPWLFLPPPLLLIPKQTTCLLKTSFKTLPPAPHLTPGLGPLLTSPPALPQSTEEPQQAKSCERWGPRQTMEQEAECVLCVSSGMAMGHTILGENTVKRPLKSKKVNKGTPFLKSIYSINC